jgi:uncharacterized membrane protein
LPAAAAVRWLAAGWRDLTAQPATSLVYGLGVFVVSVVIVAGLFAFGLDYILFPAFAGFMVVGPILAVGLYEKSRRIASGEPARLGDMIFVRAASGGQLWFTGVLLCLLMLLWMRAAVNDTWAPQGFTTFYNPLRRLDTLPLAGLYTFVFVR